MIKVENWQELVKLLEGISPQLRKRLSMDGLIAGANLINNTAKQNLEAGKKGKSKSGYNYYQTIFRYEQMKGQDPELLKLKTGVWSRANGYKLRWLEWGTDDRYTRLRYNPLKKKKIDEQFRGRIEGNNYFFNAVRDSQSDVFRVVSKAVLDGLRKASYSK